MIKNVCNTSMDTDVSNSNASQIVGSIQNIVHAQITQHLRNPKEMKCMYMLTFIWNRTSSGHCSVTILAKVAANIEPEGIRITIEYAVTTHSGKNIVVQRQPIGLTSTLFHLSWTDYEQCLFRFVIDHETSEWKWYVLAGYYDDDYLDNQDIRLDIKKVDSNATTSDLTVNQLN